MNCTSCRNWFSRNFKYSGSKTVGSVVSRNFFSHEEKGLDVIELKTIISSELCFSACHILVLSKSAAGELNSKNSTYISIWWFSWNKSEMNASVALKNSCFIWRAHKKQAFPVIKQCGYIFFTSLVAWTALSIAVSERSRVVLLAAVKLSFTISVP